VGAGQLLARARRVRGRGHRAAHMEVDGRVRRPQRVDTELDVQEKTESGAHGRRPFHGGQQRRDGRSQGERRGFSGRVRVRAMGMHTALHGRFQTRRHLVGRRQGFVERRSHGKRNRPLPLCYSPVDSPSVSVLCIAL